MFSHPKHLALAPIYWYQAKRIQQTTLRLPEPDGDRQGRIDLQATNEQDSLRQSDELKQSDASYRLMIVGDSSAAGVGVENQQQALSHQLLAELKNHLYTTTIKLNGNCMQLQVIIALMYYADCMYYRPQSKP